MSARIKVNEITDGFGSVWQRCEAGDKCGLEVVRPGKVQCSCDGMEMPRADAMALAEFCGADFHDVCFIVCQAERRGRGGTTIARSAREVKVIDGLLDALPFERWTEQELALWLAVFSDALRHHYGVSTTAREGW